MRLRLCGLLLLLAPALAGCGGANGSWSSLGGLGPVIANEPTKLRTGWGGEATVLLQERGQVRFAWSHHEGEPGWPDAEYLRLGWAFLIGSPDARSWYPSSSTYFRIILLGGVAYNQLIFDGPGDVGGLGFTFEPEFCLEIRDRTRISFGCVAEGWLSPEGDFIGALAPYVRFGFTF